MDVDLFVQHLNKEKYSVARGLKHFDSNMSSSMMTNLMKGNGYKYNSKDRLWIKEVHIPSHEVNSHDFTLDESSSHEFTFDEVLAIRNMIYKSDPVEVGLVSRIESLPKDEKVRKTIVISQSVGDKLDEFCKVKRVQKSSVLELAIEDIIKRYE
jgi:hypothetical protein